MDLVGAYIAGFLSGMIILTLSFIFIEEKLWEKTKCWICKWCNQE